MSIKFGVAAAALAVGLIGIAPASAQLIIPTRAVQQPGNAPDPFTGNIYGSVAYEYNIGRYEVTNAQYAVFLNAIAATDTFEVYSPGMGIDRAGSPGSYTYTVQPDRAQHPIENVTYWDATRFANWLHNGQPIGAQDNTTTEDGAYTLTAEGMSENTVTRNPGWRWAIPSADEWYKAAYHRPRENGGAIGDYWLYPAFYDNIPAANFGNIFGDTAPVGSYIHNFTFRGLHDLAGNVAEWTEETAEGSDQIYGVIRGGHHGSVLSALRSDNFGANGRENQVGRIGIRVCRFPACPADRNDNLVVDVPDIFVFLASWFAQDFPDCDFNHDDRVDVADIFAFLSAWFAGC